MNQIFNSDCLEGLRNLPSESVNCCVTSPPYFGLRDYGTDGQIGLESTPDEFVAKLVEVFTEVRRVLKADGTLWLNLGDSYAGSWGNAGGQNRGNGSQRDITKGSAVKDQAERNGDFVPPAKYGFKDLGIKPKDLIGIPWMVAFALRSSGWYLRQDIIWHKPNPMPESVTDRCTKAHEYIFLLSKSQKYYYDHEAIKEQGKDPADDYRRIMQQRIGNKSEATERVNGLRVRGHEREHVGFRKWDQLTKDEQQMFGANKRSVWSVATKPFSEAHFATFPEDLIVDCIKAGCPEGGLVLDPFMGAGTTALVAAKLGRNYVGFELNPEYIRIAEKRLRNELGMFYKATA